MTFDHEDLQPVEERLRAARPALSPLELDAVKRRVRASTGTAPRRRQPMKSRLTIVAMLVVGGLFSTAGAGLAVTGASSTNASVAQYGTVTPTPTGGVKGETGGNSGGPGGGGVEGVTNTNGAPGTNGGVSPAATGPAATGPGAVQPARQVAQGASGSQLPFTGFAAIPVLLLGLALLAGGLVLRRRTTLE